MLRTLGFTRPSTPPKQRAADLLEANKFETYRAQRLSGRARSISPKSEFLRDLKNARDRAWEEQQIENPNLARRASRGVLRASRGALNLAQGASNLAVRASRGALNLAQGASRGALNYFRGRAAPAAAADTECSICSNDTIVGVVGPQEAVLVDCPVSHRYHRGCIDSWINTCMRNEVDITCPNCRGVITTFTAVKKGGGYRTRGRRTRSKSKSRRYPRKPHKTRKV
jgi:hypothetical protein